GLSGRDPDVQGPPGRDARPPPAPEAGGFGPAARRARAREGGLDVPRRGPPAHLGAWGLCPRPERGDSWAAGPADFAARASAGAPAGQEPAWRAAAVPLPNARPGRHARPPQGHRRGVRPALP